MRYFLVFVFGIAVGVGGAIAYSSFATAQVTPPAAPVADNPPISVTLGEPFLTAIVQSVPTKLDNVSVKAEDGVLVVRGTANVLGQPAAASAKLRPVVSGGALHVEVVNTELGELAVPMEQLLETQLDRRIHALLADMQGVTITGATVTAGRGLVITCNVDPRVVQQQISNAR